MYNINKKIVNTIFITAILLGFMNISCKGHKGATGSTGLAGTAASLYEFTSLTCVPGINPTLAFSVLSTDTTPGVTATCQVLCIDVSGGPGQKGSFALSTYFTLPADGTFTLPPQGCDGTTCKAGNNIDCTIICAASGSSFGVNAITTLCP